jgi:phosphoglucosamine mutase
MREHGFNVGGEQSGHIIFSDFTTTGDGLLAAMQILSVVKQMGRPVSEVCHMFEPLPQILKNVRVSHSARALTSSEGIVHVIEDAKRRLGESGRLIIRPSGTEPVIRVMGEGDDRELVEQLVDDICAALSAKAA